MTVFVPTTSDTLSGVRHTLTTTDRLLINAGISVGSTNSLVIDASGVGSSVFIAGTAFGAGSGGAVQIAMGTIEVGQTGTVYSSASGGNGAVLLSAGASLTNDGTIAASQGLGVILTDADTNAFNSGRISGGNGGVFMGLFDNDNQQLTNTGSISSGVRVDQGLRFGHGVQIEGDFATMNNAGDIRAIAPGKAGVHLSGFVPEEVASGVRISNAGTIDSLLGWGVDAFDNLTAGFTLVNSGTIGGGAGAIRGTAGVDTITNAGVITGNVSLGLSNDRFRGDAGTSAETVYGGAGTDSVVGGAFDDIFYGGSGVDTLLGGAGDDRLYGGTGGDDLFGGAGDDTMSGGAGNDDDRINALSDVVSEGAGASNGTADRIFSSTISVNLNLYRNVEGATLTGIAALNLTGTAGANTLIGNAAANLLSGGVGRDTLTGGVGHDTFVFSSAADTGVSSGSRDSITDFAVGVDDLRMIFMASYIGAANFTAAGQVRYVAATGVLSGSTDGDVAAEWTLQMATGLALTSGDFVF